MKPSILLLAVITAVAFSSCSTAYKTGQTPDDVYFSPVTPEDEYVRVERKDRDRYQGTDEYYDDRYLRMRVHNRTRWSELDDWYYYGGRYNYSYYNTWGIYNPWNPYTYWNCTHNPYYAGTVIISPSSPTYSKPRTFNLNTFNNNSLTNNTYTPRIGKLGTGSSAGSNNSYGNDSYNNSGRGGSNTGSFLRDLFSGGNNNS
ncbi:MAG TPA: hypothetical protein VF476_05170, partial [Chitinophagaceae bacterium]